MADASFEGTIETVRGRLGDERADQLLGFWSSQGALEGEAARRRLPQVVCVALDGAGKIAGVNSVYAEDVALLGGRRFWIYRSFLLPAASSAESEMTNAAFAALQQEFEGSREGPIGLCVLLGDQAEIKRRPEAVTSETELMFAGYTSDQSQVRVRYFEDAVIGPGLPNSQSVSETRAIDYSLGDRYRVEPFAETDDVTADDVLALWAREHAMPEVEAQRRVHEVLNVVIERDQGLVALSTAYLGRNTQLRMDLWYFRTYVAAAHRHTHVATQLTFRNRDLLERRFVSGEDTRAAGVAFELEHEGMKTYYNRAVWVPADFTFIGENERGDHVRVHYFPGVRVPGPG
jgi:hypothetical protein